MLNGLIFKIDRYATHDGPGIRTNIYFKGCPLCCAWCSNPEGQRPVPELGFQASRCDGCGSCLTACSAGAIRVGSGKPVIDSVACDLCGRCVDGCGAGALFLYGKTFNLKQLMDIIERDRHIYRRSGGGITCTGGEPFLQSEFLKQLLEECQNAGIHTAVETCGCVDEAKFSETIQGIDWLFFDLKHVDQAKHIELTGRSNAVILHNLKTASDFLGDKGRVLVLRQVLVPGLNDGSNIEALAALAEGLPHVDLVELLPYHAYGAHKYQTLGRAYSLGDLEAPSISEMERYKSVLESYGIRCKIGGL